MIRHTVTFRLNGSPAVRREVAIRFRDALTSLPDIIPELISLEAGVNENPAEDWDVTLTATAATMEDIKTYSAHPAHLAAVEIIAPYKAERACVDYSV